MGERGVRRDPLLPRKYALNAYAGKVLTVPNIAQTRTLIELIQQRAEFRTRLRRT